MPKMRDFTGYVPSRLRPIAAEAKEKECLHCHKVKPNTFEFWGKKFHGTRDVKDMVTTDVCKDCANDKRAAKREVRRQADAMYERDKFANLLILQGVDPEEAAKRAESSTVIPHPATSKFLKKDVSPQDKKSKDECIELHGALYCRQCLELKPKTSDYFYGPYTGGKWDQPCKMCIKLRNTNKKKS